ncbi:hypothetical protein, partial [Chryseobacterium sp.]|uniref:hypothetical protein n=1 Tax=Chryseobacterium sp. TaxID=1871047 RepID=UPI0035C6A6F7
LYRAFRTRYFQGSVFAAASPPQKLNLENELRQLLQSRLGFLCGKELFLKILIISLLRIVFFLTTPSKILKNFCHPSKGGEFHYINN